MNSIIKYFTILLIILPIACKNKDSSTSLIQEEDLDLQMIAAYKEGMQLERFLKTYPNHIRKDYAHYLLGMSYYDQITSEKKDLGPIEEAKKNFEFVIKNYPNTDFALDSEFKLELIEEMLAAKEMYLAKYYIQREKWIPAINRYKNVIENYETSIYVEEALHRLVEIYFRIGLIDESKKYASLLGYNYQSGEWYEHSYRVFNKNYKKISKSNKIKNKKSTLEKIKSLLK